MRTYQVARCFERGRERRSSRWQYGLMAAVTIAPLIEVALLMCPSVTHAAPATQPVSPADGTAAYVYHLDGNLKNSGTAGAAGDLTDNGFASFVDSPLNASFGQAAFDSPKLSKNHVKVPLASITDSNGSVTIEAVIQFPKTGPNSDPNQARFTIASYGGEDDLGANTRGGGIYLNYNADPAMAALITREHPGNAGRVQLVVNNRVRGTDNAFSRQFMVNALVPVTATAGSAYRVVATWDNTTGIAVIGWSPISIEVKADALPPADFAGKVTGSTGLAINGTSYNLVVGGSETEDGGNGFPAANVKIDDVRFVAGVESSAIAAQQTTAPASQTTAH